MHGTIWYMQIKQLSYSFKKQHAITRVHAVVIILSFENNYMQNHKLNLYQILGYVHTWNSSCPIAESHLCYILLSHIQS